MAVEFYIPKMSDHMEEAVFIEWLVAEGDAVEKGQPILMIDTDKVVAEVEAPASGLLTGIRPGLDDGVTIPVGETVAFIVEDIGDEVPALEPLGAPVSASLHSESPQPTQVADLQDMPTGATPPVQPSGGPVRATPAGRKAARELDVDLADVPGSGPGGRVSESDVRAYATKAVATGSSSGGDRDTESLGLTSVQKITAARMVESVTTVPQFSVVRHLDMTAVLGARESFGSEGPSRPSVTAYLVKAIALALTDHPRVNGIFREDRVEINSDINVGVAMGTDEGLFVPVIHKADQMTVTEIADDLAGLRELADGQGFALSDLDGGTFTLSNLGMFGVDEFQAIVNPPQAAILATGRVSKVAVVNDDGSLGVGDSMTATITADHRALDGVAAAVFLSSVSELLQNPDQYLSVTP